MRKNISLSITLLLCISILLAVVSCTAKNPFEEFKNKMFETNNYQITTHTYISSGAYIAKTTQVDGNIKYTASNTLGMNTDTYIETVGEIEYLYKKSYSGAWEKTERSTSNNSSDLTSKETIITLFNRDAYVKIDKNVFKQKEDFTFEKFKDVIITFAEDTCTIEMVYISEMMAGMFVEYETKVMISDIGKINLTLPVVEMFATNTTNL